MNVASQPQGSATRWTVLFLSLIIAVAAVGFFAGINDGVPHEQLTPTATMRQTRHAAGHQGNQSGAIVAASYDQMRRSESGPTSEWKSTLRQIPQPTYDLFAELKPSEKEKQQSSLTRSSRRAFNGAPPIIPHPVERTSDSACYACHGEGMRIDGRRANRMSHGFLANCTQCHATPAPKTFADVDGSVKNDFVGLKAPMKGERAFPGAPPTIPHSTWMRDRCLSCHGGEAGWPGLESTHPWRHSCQQCHAPSASLEQAVTAHPIGFLSPPEVNVSEVNEPEVNEQSGGNARDGETR